MFDRLETCGEGRLHQVRRWIVDSVAVRGWPLLVLVSLVSLGVAAQGSPRAGPSEGLRRVPAAELRANILAGLEQIPLPERTLAQRFEVRAVPTVELPLGPYRLQLVARLSEVGEGTLDVDLEDADGGHRPLRVAVTRHVRAVLARATVPLPPGTVLAASHVVMDTTWVEGSLQWQQARVVAEDPTGWRVQRAVAAGALLREGDLRRLTERDGNAVAGASALDPPVSSGRAAVEVSKDGPP